MSSAVETVEAFLVALAGSGSGAMAKAIHAYFTPTTVWENVGMSTTTGPEQAVAILDSFEASMGVTAMGIDNLAVAAQGNKVLTERVDRLLKADGTEVAALRVMGILEVENGKITAWRDYFDTASLAG